MIISASLFSYPTPSHTLSSHPDTHRHTDTTDTHTHANTDTRTHADTDGQRDDTRESSKIFDHISWSRTWVLGLGGGHSIYLNDSMCRS